MFYVETPISLLFYSFSPRNISFYLLIHLLFHQSTFCNTCAQCPQRRTTRAHRMRTNCAPYAHRMRTVCRRSLQFRKRLQKLCSKIRHTFLSFLQLLRKRLKPTYTPTAMLRTHSLPDISECTSSNSISYFCNGHI